METDNAYIVFGGGQKTMNAGEYSICRCSGRAYSVCLLVHAGSSAIPGCASVSPVLSACRCVTRRRTTSKRRGSVSTPALLIFASRPDTVRALQTDHSISWRILGETKTLQMIHIGQNVTKLLFTLDNRCKIDIIWNALFQTTLYLFIIT